MREKILIAENNTASLHKLSNILEQNNFRVVTASRREEMLAQIQV